MAGVEAYPRFAEVIAAGADDIDLTRAALAIGELEYPDLDTDRYLALLARLADQALRHVEHAESRVDRVLRLNQFLYEYEGFQGNRAHYYDTRNSYLNEVLERRTGIPITLAIMYIDVAARLGMDARGVGFPGHFLVKCVDGSEILVDPFSGELISGEEVEERFQAAVGDKVSFDPRVLESASASRILARVLGNLKQIHLARNEFEAALSAVDRMLMLDPEDAGELRDRGLIYAKLECFRAATDDLERFLELAPQDPSARAIARQLDKLRGRARLLN
jgi:regulator of sirC expression with transglutaminase-like and TPR domain